MREKDASNDIQNDVRIAKLKGIFGQMGTLKMWKNDPDQQYKQYYQKLADNEEAKKKFDALYQELSGIQNQSEVSKDIFEKLETAWHEILNLIFPKP